MIRLLVLAMLTIIASALHPAALAGERVPARLGGGVAGGLMEAQSDSANAAPARCPFHFASDMPAATFCVYRGVALGGSGEVCATDVVVIWSSFAPQAAMNRERAKPAAAPRREVRLGFVAAPDLVVRAIVDLRRSNRAEMVGYVLSSTEAPQPLSGQMTLRAVRFGSADVLSMDVRESKRFNLGGCEFASYSGTFLGVMRPPSMMKTFGDIGEDRP